MFRSIYCALTTNRTLIWPDKGCAAYFPKQSRFHRNYNEFANHVNFLASNISYFTWNRTEESNRTLARFWPCRIWKLSCFMFLDYKKTTPWFVADLFVNYNCRWPLREQLCEYFLFFGLHLVKFCDKQNSDPWDRSEWLDFVVITGCWLDWYELALVYVTTFLKSSPSSECCVGGVHSQ